MLPDNGPWPVLTWFNPHNQRYYHADLHRDLLGDLILTQAWGHLKSRQGRVVHKLFERLEDAHYFLKKIHRRRVQHGYHLAKQMAYTTPVNPPDYLTASR